MAASPDAQQAALTAAERQLFDAVQRGDAAAAEALLSAGAAAANTADTARGGLRPLHLAAREGHYSIVVLLLQHGAGVNAANTSGRTALHCAALYGHLEVAWLLLDRGADVNAVGVSESEVGNFASCQPLHLAAYHCRAEVVELLLGRGADVRAWAAWGDATSAMPLHLAVDGLGSCSLEKPALLVGRALLDAGAPVDAADSNGRQALHFAAQEGRVEVARLLLDRGADVHALATWGDTVNMTPLHFAAAGSAEAEAVVAVVRALLDAGASIDAADSDDWQALHWAVTRGAEVAALLLARGADVNAAEDNGKTPLHLAARHLDRPGVTDVARQLLERGADVCAINKHGRTPLHVAAEHDHLRELVELVADARVANLHAGMQHVVVGMAAEAARLRQERAAWQRQQVAMAHQIGELERERAAWQQERAALAHQQAALARQQAAWQERAALEAARGGGAGERPQSEEPVAKRTRRSGGC